MEELVPQEFAGHLQITFLIRVRHCRSVLPLPGPLHGTSQIHWIFDDAGINQVFAIRTEAEVFRQVFLRAAGQ